MDIFEMKFKIAEQIHNSFAGLSPYKVFDCARDIIAVLESPHSCCCGSPETLGMVHRKNKPCYVAEDKTEKEPEQINKMFPVSECCNAGAKQLITGDYLCTNCTNVCHLTDWSKPKPSPVKVPERLLYDLGENNQSIIDTINSLIDWAKGVENILAGKK